jgi:hypothetical protein
MKVAVMASLLAERDMDVDSGHICGLWSERLLNTIF